MPNPVAVTIVTVGMYRMSRHATDTGVQIDVIKAVGDAYESEFSGGYMHGTRYIGSEPIGPSMVVDMCEGVQSRNKIKDSVVVGFQ
ncbi:hypothetical protein PVL29_020780 [Vitis rotundifolia]|uniref:Uncharacterized protein n=1 Tax=Vitis rotundifolia TaxID=103349 RepID=A0AA38YXU8_VITRO|nr:hypothetical protein PVL29_020780 [Vitis rotundifolia]